MMETVLVHQANELAQRAIQALQEVNTQLEQQVVEMRPKAEIYDMLEGRGDAKDMAAAANDIAEALGIELGCKRLYSMLRVMGIIQQSKNHARQMYVDCGYFKNVTPIRGGQMRYTAKVTPKGIAWLTKRVAGYLAGDDGAEHLELE